MRVNVKRGDVQYVCTTEEQLQSFLEDGYVEVKAEEETPLPASKKNRKSK